MAGTAIGLRLAGSTSKILRAMNHAGKTQLPMAYLNTVDQLRTYSAEAASKAEGRTMCTLIPGDGVGPELMQSMKDVLEAAGAPVDFETCLLSDIQPSDVKLDDVVNSIERNGVCIKGVLTSPMAGDQASLDHQLRTKLGLFASVIRLESMPGVKTRHKNINMIMIREQTEGEFSSIEHEAVNGIVECYKIVTEEKSKRVAKFAFDYATKHNRKKVTAIHKANIMKLGDGLFLRCCKDVSKMYPRIEFDSMIVDNCTMQMVSNPHQFDVLVMGNLYGSILDNIGAGLVGGAGIVVGSSYSPNSVMYEPGARHTFSEATGKDVANPTAVILCAAKMLRHTNSPYYGNMIFNAVEKVLKTGKVLTKDLGGQSSTLEYTTAIIGALKH